MFNIEEIFYYDQTYANHKNFKKYTVNENGYCAFHTSRSYLKPKEKERRKK